MDEIHFPNTVHKHILEYEQVKEAHQKEEEESVLVVKELLDETKDEEVTKEAIMAMYALLEICPRGNNKCVIIHISVS